MLGIVAHFLVRREKPNGDYDWENALEERVLQLGRFQRGEYSEERIRETHLGNVRALRNLLLGHVIPLGVRLYRVSSSLLPLADKVSHLVRGDERLSASLRAAGEVALAHGVRLTMHPGQFCVLSSQRDTVVSNAVAELAHHAWIMDEMGLPRTPQFPINIHGGVRDGSERLTRVIDALPDHVRARLTLENCESAYSVAELLPISRATRVPVVFDSHHHTFRAGGLSIDEAYAAARETWPDGITPLQHLASTEPELRSGSFADRRKHSDVIHWIPDCQLAGLKARAVDVEVEAKAKNLAVMRLSREYDIPLV